MGLAIAYFIWVWLDELERLLCYKMSAFFIGIVNFPNILVRYLHTSIPILWNWDMDRLGQAFIMKRESWNSKFTF